MICVCLSVAGCSTHAHFFRCLLTIYHALQLATNTFFEGDSQETADVKEKDPIQETGRRGGEQMIPAIGSPADTPAPPPSSKEKKTGYGLVGWWNLLFMTPRNEDTSINRTHFTVLNTLFAYVTTPEIRTPHLDGHFVLSQECPGKRHTCPIVGTKQVL